MKVGVVGCGDVAQNVYLPNLAALAQSGRIELSALADLNLDLARTLAGRFAIPHTFADAEDLLATDVDLVVNLTPSQVHAEVSLKALARGKHVYTEKPIAATLEDADAVVAAAQAGDARMAAAPALLTHPMCSRRCAGSSPACDRQDMLRARPRQQPGAGPDHRLSHRSELVLPDGCRPAVRPRGLSAPGMTAALGPVRRVTAFSGIALAEREAGFGSAKGKAISVEVDDNTHLLLDFGEARFASLDATYCVLSSQGPRMEFYGADGVVNLAATADEPPISLFRVDQPTRPARLDHSRAGLSRRWVNPPAPARAAAALHARQRRRAFPRPSRGPARRSSSRPSTPATCWRSCSPRRSPPGAGGNALRTGFDWDHLRNAIA